ncbi:MAG: LacI family DNA-binding transcriptional regulator [Pseudomonadota bacterium]
MTMDTSPQRPRRAKIDDVAELAGVSTKTVSRVLNNEPNVRAETRERVKAAAKKLSYSPDLSARSLAGQRSYMFALFYDTISEGYLSKFQSGALDRCRDRTYHLMVGRFDVEAADVVEQIVQAAERTRVDGVLLLPPLSDHPHIGERLWAAGIACVLIAPSNPQGSMPFIDLDDMNAARTLTGHFLKQGHTRIGFIEGHTAHGAAALRRLGYLAALEDAGLPIDPDLLVQGWFTVASGRLAAERLLALNSPPTAIFASNDEMAAGAEIVIFEHGLSVPRDISVVGFDDSLLASTASPPLTTVRQPIEEMAQGAVDLLIEVNRKGVAGYDVTAESRRYDFELVVRQSTVPGFGEKA